MKNTFQINIVSLVTCRFALGELGQFALSDFFKNIYTITALERDQYDVLRSRVQQ